MAEKDIVEKTLEDYNDVFADIVNVFLFNGKRRVKENELENTKARAQLKIDGKIHEQERDVVKRWIRENIRIAFVGFENQSSVDNTEPLRVLSYDGSLYKEQLAEIEECRRIKVKVPKLIPVVTLVIYFGAKKWKKTRLHEVIEIPEYLKEYVSDYKINLFDIKDLTREQVELFQSDFKIIADHFYQLYHCEDYVPSKEKITHVDALLKLMSVLCKDNRYENAVADLNLNEKEGLHMCEILDKFIARGEARGIQIGESRGEARGIQIGESRGVEIGEQKLSKLLGLLKNAGRMEDFDRAIADKDYRKELYKEFGI